MSKVNELRTQRAKAWDKAQAFLTANRNDKGILSEEDVRTYEALEQDIVNLGHEIERQERLEDMEREMAAPVSDPITAKPEASKKMDTKTGTAADSYNKAFWTQVRSRNGITYEVKNALSEGVDSEGIYLIRYLHSFPAAYSLYLGKSLRFFLYDPESILFKAPYYTCSQCKSYTFYCP